MILEPLILNHYGDVNMQEALFEIMPEIPLETRSTRLYYMNRRELDKLMLEGFTPDDYTQDFGWATKRNVNFVGDIQKGVLYG